MEKITMDGHYQTRDGRAVTVKFVDGRGAYSVAGYIDGIDTLFTWTAAGQHLSEMQDQCADLIPKPKRHKYERWHVLFGDGGSDLSASSFGSAAEASRYATLHREYRKPVGVALVSIDIPEGEGLEPK